MENKIEIPEDLLNIGYNDLNYSEKTNKENIYNINTNTVQNKYLNKPNVLYTYDNKSNQITKEVFIRNGKNNLLIEKITKIEDTLLNNAKREHINYKEKIAKENPNNEINTKWTYRDVNRELNLYFTKNDKYKFSTILKPDKKNIINLIPDLENKITEVANSILEHKNLDIKNNLISIILYCDDGDTFKIKINYNDYSHKKHLTNNQIKKNISEINVRDMFKFNSEENKKMINNIKKILGINKELIFDKIVESPTPVRENIKIVVDKINKKNHIR